jgi:hypothetical protein
VKKGERKKGGGRERQRVGNDNDNVSGFCLSEYRNSLRSVRNKTLAVKEVP